MADTQNQKNNLIPNEPSLKDLLDLHKKDIFLSLNCHAIGQIETFNPAKQTATVSLKYKRTRFQYDATAGAYLPVLLNYPLMADAPVHVLGGGGGAITFPIVKGDECLVCFNDRDIDNWFNGAANGAVATSRTHSFSDAIILVGVRSIPNVLTDYDGTNIVIRIGQLKATFRPGGGVQFENNTGNFFFKDNADITFDTATVQGLFGHGGHVQFKNVAGNELIAILIALMQDILLAQTTTPGNPILLPPTFATDLAKLETFLEP